MLNVTHFWFGVEETTAPKTSYQHDGLRIDGKDGSFLYEASYAQQRGYKASTTTPARQYRMGMVGFSHWGVTFKAVDEELEGGFDTPLSSLHGFYGWSDRIGRTPAKGLVDRYLLAETKQWEITFEGQIHRFTTQQDGQDYGKEWDLQVYRSFKKNLTLTLKWASYQADSTAPSTNSLNKDLKKFWVMTTLKF